MKLRAFSIAFLLSIARVGPAAELSEEADKYWPQWRGPHATGVSRHASPPIEWSETRNIRWKVEIPGRGASIPVLWGERIYLTTAVPMEKTVPSDSVAPPRSEGGFRHPMVSPATRYYQFTVVAIDRGTGETTWQKAVQSGLPHEGTHQYAPRRR